MYLAYFSSLLSMLDLTYVDISICIYTYKEKKKKKERERERERIDIKAGSPILTPQYFLNNISLNMAKYACFILLIALSLTHVSESIFGKSSVPKVPKPKLPKLPTLPKYERLPGTISRSASSSSISRSGSFSRDSGITDNMKIYAQTRAKQMHQHFSGRSSSMSETGTIPKLPPPPPPPARSGSSNVGTLPKAVKMAQPPPPARSGSSSSVRDNGGTLPKAVKTAQPPPPARSRSSSRTRYGEGRRTETNVGSIRRPASSIGGRRRGSIIAGSRRGSEHFYENDYNILYESQLRDRSVSDTSLNHIYREIRGVRQSRPRALLNRIVGTTRERLTRSRLGNLVKKKIKDISLALVSTSALAMAGVLIDQGTGEDIGYDNETLAITNETDRNGTNVQVAFGLPELTIDGRVATSNGQAIFQCATFDGIMKLLNFDDTERNIIARIRAILKKANLKPQDFQERTLKLVRSGVEMSIKELLKVLMEHRKQLRKERREREEKTSHV
jgi:hypothetical protein